MPDFPAANPRALTGSVSWDLCPVDVYRLPSAPLQARQRGGRKSKRWALLRARKRVIGLVLFPVPPRSGRSPSKICGKFPIYGKSWWSLNIVIFKPWLKCGEGKYGENHPNYPFPLTSSIIQKRVLLLGFISDAKFCFSYHLIFLSTLSVAPFPRTIVQFLIVSDRNHSLSVPCSLPGVSFRPPKSLVESFQTSASSSSEWQ